MIGFLFELSFDHFSLQDMLRLRSTNKKIKAMIDSRYKPHLKSFSFVEKSRHIDPNTDWSTQKTYSNDFTIQKFYLVWNQRLPILSPYRKNFFSWFRSNPCKPLCWGRQEKSWEASLILKINQLDPNDLVGIGVSNLRICRSFLVGYYGSESLGFHLNQGIICKDNSLYYNEKVSPAQAGDEICMSVHYKTKKISITKNKKKIYERSLRGSFLSKPLHFIATGIMKCSYDLDFHIGVG